MSANCRKRGERYARCPCRVFVLHSDSSFLSISFQLSQTCMSRRLQRSQRPPPAHRPQNPHPTAMRTPQHHLARPLQHDLSRLRRQRPRIPRDRCGDRAYNPCLLRPQNPLWRLRPPHQVSGHQKSEGAVHAPPSPRAPSAKATPHSPTELSRAPLPLPLPPPRSPARGRRAHLRPPRPQRRFRCAPPRCAPRRRRRSRSFARRSGRTSRGPRASARSHSSLCSSHCCRSLCAYGPDTARALRPGDRAAAGRVRRWMACAGG